MKLLNKFTLRQSFIMLRSAPSFQRIASLLFTYITLICPLTLKLLSSSLFYFGSLIWFEPTILWYTPMYLVRYTPININTHIKFNTSLIELANWQVKIISQLCRKVHYNIGIIHCNIENIHYSMEKIHLLLPV